MRKVIKTGSHCLYNHSSLQNTIQSIVITASINIDMETKLCRNHLMDQNFGLCITPHDFILPYCNSPGVNYYRPWKWCMDSDIKDFGSTIDNQKESFKITLDVQHFRPEEINVMVNEKEITIEGKHEERKDSHGFISRQFKRRYDLPIDCLSENMFSTLSSDGILTVIANKKSLKQNKDKEIAVPIQIYGSCPMKLQVETKKQDAPETKKVENLVSEDIKKKIEDTLNNNTNLEVMNKNNVEKLLKDNDKFCMLKPDITKDTMSTTDQILMEARKETDNLLKMATEMAQSDTLSSLGKLEKTIGKSNLIMSDLAEKVSEKTTANISETNFKSMIKETVESEEISSFKSTMKANMKMSGEARSEFITDISAELREAADNI